MAGAFIKISCRWSHLTAKSSPPVGPFYSSIIKKYSVFKPPKSTSKLPNKNTSILQNKLVQSNNLKYIGNRSTGKFHTSSRRPIIPPVIWVFVKPVAKIATIFGGRFFRKYYQKLSPKNQAAFRRKYQSAVGIGIVSLCVAAIANYNYHLKETPITNRKRYIAFNNDQIMKLVLEEANGMKEQMKDHIVKPDDPSYEKVSRVVHKILTSNQDLQFFREQKWTICIIDSSAANALVLPDGHIFVFKGLFDMAKTEDQLAVVIGHEMAHALLQHGCEKLAIAQLLDYFIIATMAAIWAIMPNDGIAFVTHWFYHKVIDLFISLPYSRKLEAEADEVGLVLIAKACYDVREAANFWLIMHVQCLVDQLLNSGENLPEWLSTHPDHDKRAVTLDLLVPPAVKLREQCNCKDLPLRDPRADGLFLLKEYQKMAEAKRQQEIEEYEAKLAEAQRAELASNTGIIVKAHAGNVQTS